MLETIKNIFRGERSTDENTAEELFKNEKTKKKGNCDECLLAPMCSERGEYDYRCDYAPEMNSFDKSKDSIVLVEDNAGVISFLEEDIKFLEEKKILQKNKFNVLSFTGKLAAFNFEVAQRKLKGLNIKYAILDITLGGSIMTDDGNIKYTGVDVYEMILKYNPEVKILFYTGNNLNPYINANTRIIKQFSKITNGKNIMDYILFKTSLDMDSRRVEIAERLFGSKKTDLN